MQQQTSGVAPYQLPSIGSVASKNPLNWLFQPLQQNSSGTIPGTTVINIGQVISIDGNKDYIVISNPNGIRQMIIGKLPDGTYGMAISKPGIDVFGAFT